MKRPRLLVPLGILGILAGLISLIVAWSTLIAFSSSHDNFMSAVQVDPGRMLGLPAGAAKPEELAQLAKQKAEILWSRRQVLLPLAGANAIAAMLVLLGVFRVLSPRSQKKDWGRSAWQLGLLVGLPCLALETLTGWSSARELVTSVANLHDPISEQLHAGAPLGFLFGQAAATAVYLLGGAAYLGSRGVKTWSRASDGATSA